MSKRKRFFGPDGFPILLREAAASARLDGETIDLGPPTQPGRGANPAVTDGAGLADRLRELRADLAVRAEEADWWVAGRDAGMWLASLEALAEQADALELDRDIRRKQVSRVRAEAASWDRVMDEQAENPSAAVATAVWCSERIRFALGD